MGDRRRVANLAAVVVGSVALAAGCASGSDASTTVDGSTSTSIGATTSVVAPSSVTPSTVVTTTAAAAPTQAAATTAPAPDPAATLEQGLAGLGTSYHFATTATVDGAVVATAEGDRIGDGSRLAVTANGATVNYVLTPDGTWVQQPGADWESLDDPPATTDPVLALAAPTSVAPGNVDGTTVTVQATVPATALGIAGDGDVPVAATVTDGVLTAVTYATELAGKPASVTATFGIPADASPVTAPA